MLAPPLQRVLWSAAPVPRYIVVDDRDHRPRLMERLKDLGGQAVILNTRSGVDELFRGVGQA